MVGGLVACLPADHIFGLCLPCLVRVLGEIRLVCAQDVRGRIGFSPRAPYGVPRRRSSFPVRRMAALRNGRRETTLGSFEHDTQRSLQLATRHRTREKEKDGSLHRPLPRSRSPGVRRRLQLECCGILGVFSFSLPES
jgi:hypothetical protein